MRKMKRRKLANMWPSAAISEPSDESVTCEDIWDVVCDTPEEAASMRAKTILMIELIHRIERSHLKLGTVANICGIPKENLKLLLRGRISKISIEELERFLHALSAQEPTARHS